MSIYNHILFVISREKKSKICIFIFRDFIYLQCYVTTFPLNYELYNYHYLCV